MPRISTRKRPAVPATRSESVDEQRLRAYELLGVTQQQALVVPQISHILRDARLYEKAYEYLRGSDEADAKKFIAVYDVLAIHLRKLLPIEAYCVASGLTTKRVLEMIMGECMTQSNHATELLVRANHADVVQATLESAVNFGKDGVQDRKMILSHTNFLPVPKTNVVNVHGNVDASQHSNVQNISIGQLGQIENKMRGITDRFNAKMGVKEIEDKAVDGEFEEVMESETVHPTGNGESTRSDVEGDHRASETSDMPESVSSSAWSLD